MGIRLLNDLRTLFLSQDGCHLASAECLRWLNSLDGAPWPTWNNGTGLNSYHLNKLLKPYEIHTRDIRINDHPNPVKGIHRNDLEDAFHRWLPSPDAGGTPSNTATSRHRDNTRTSRHVAMSRSPGRASGANGPSTHPSRRVHPASASHTNDTLGMTTIPGEARDGLMRAWIEILRERHPEVAWIPTPDGPSSPPSASRAAPDSAEAPI
ncbi:MAG: DUF3631 domain-containing protein [Solirubrobacterales bacterium]